MNHSTDLARSLSIQPIPSLCTSHWSLEEEPQDEEDDESVVGSDVEWVSIRDGEVGMR